MATVQRPATPSFRAVNTVDFASTEVSARNMATPRSRLTPPPSAPSAPPATTTTTTSTTTTTTSSSYDFRSHTTPTIKDENPSPSRMSCTLEDDEANDHDEDRDSLEPAEKSGGSGKSSGRVKKKKGTKFHCTGFGSCNLAFTRSEHLARHIRKHTGERPFMCHCGRWFSRLDNLRQHSSTVHADEEIPSTSLAATGTRYQRHGRPERVRPRSRAQSQSDIQPPTEQQLQPTPPAALGSPMEDRRTRRRPDPIVVPQDVGQDEGAFNQYRDHTPPDSPISSVSTFRFGGVYRNRTATYPAVAESPAATPTSSRMGSTTDSPFGSPSGYSHRNSVVYDGTSSSVAARRLSMPHPPTPSLFAAPQVLPRPGYATPSAAPGSRRDSLTSVIDDDRRRTWHMGTQVNLNFQRDIVSPTTQSFARTTIHSPTEPGHPPIGQPRPAHTDRLPSIHHVLQEFAPSTPEHQRASWAGDILERPGTSELKRPFHEGISAVSGRRVAPGQVRSSHGRSVSNIETRRWGGGQSNPFSGPWGGDPRDRREVSLQPNTQLPVETNRHSGYFGGVLSNIPSPREHRHSFGSSDSSVSEGLVTPVAPLRAQPRILGEPGDAVFHTESPDKDYIDRSCEMTGVETTGQSPSTCNERINAGNMEQHAMPPDFPVSRLDALVSAAAVAAKI